MSDQIDAEGAPPPHSTPFLRALDRIFETAALAAFIVMILTTLLQVIARYLHIALDWTEELARILFLCSIMVGIALAIRRREHVIVDFLFANWSPRTQAAFSTFFDLVILVLLAIWLRGALRLMGLNAGTTFVSVTWFPVPLLYAIEAGAIVLMMVFVCADLLDRARRSRATGAAQ